MAAAATIITMAKMPGSVQERSGQRRREGAAPDALDNGAEGDAPHAQAWSASASAVLQSKSPGTTKSASRASDARGSPTNTTVVGRSARS